MNLNTLFKEGAIWVPKTEQAYAWLVSNGPVVVAPDLPAWMLTKLTKEGRLLRLRRGVYAVPDANGRLDLPAIAVGALVEPKGHVSFYAALAHWGLTDQDPRRVGFVSAARHSPVKVGPQTVVFVPRPGEVRRADTAGVVAAGTRVRVAVPGKAFLDALTSPRLGAAPAELLRVLDSGLLSGKLTEEDLVSRSARAGVAATRRLGVLLEALTGRARPELLKRVRSSHAYVSLAGPEGAAAKERVPTWLVETVASPDRIRAAAGVGDVG
jgi:predicted transcriptional regulator of viral defense system